MSDFKEEDGSKPTRARKKLSMSSGIRTKKTKQEPLDDFIPSIGGNGSMMFDANGVVSQEQQNNQQPQDGFINVNEINAQNSQNQIPNEANVYEFNSGIEEQNQHQDVEANFGAINYEMTSSNGNNYQNNWKNKNNGRKC